MQSAAPKNIPRLGPRGISSYLAHASRDNAMLLTVPQSVPIYSRGLPIGPPSSTRASVSHNPSPPLSPDAAHPIYNWPLRVKTAMFAPPPAPPSGPGYNPLVSGVFPPIIPARVKQAFGEDRTCNIPTSSHKTTMLLLQMELRGQDYPPASEVSDHACCVKQSRGTN